MKKFNVGIKAIIIQDDKVLLVKRSIKGSEPWWEVPGGRIEGEESIEQALHRELREELPNIKAIIMNQVIDAYRVPRDIEGEKSLVLIFYLVEADFDGEVKISDEHLDFKWADENEALEMASPGSKTAVAKAFEIINE